MTVEAFRRALSILAMSQIDVAKLFDVDPRTSRRWALGEKPVPRPVEFTLLLMLRYGVDDAQLKRWAEAGI